MNPPRHGRAKRNRRSQELGVLAFAVEVTGSRLPAAEALAAR